MDHKSHFQQASFDTPTFNRFLKRAMMLSFAILGISVYFLHQRDAYWKAEPLLIALFLMLVAIGIWLTWSASIFTLYEVEDEMIDRMWTTPSQARSFVWEIIEAFSYRHRWTILAGVLISALILPVLVIDSAIDSTYIDAPPYISPSPALLATVSVIGGLIGLNAALMMVAGSIKGTLQSGGMMKPLIGSLITTILLFGTVYAWTTFPQNLIESPYPLLIAAMLSGVPFGLRKWINKPHQFDARLDHKTARTPRFTSGLAWFVAIILIWWCATNIPFNPLSEITMFISLWWSILFGLTMAVVLFGFRSVERAAHIEWIQE